MNTKQAKEIVPPEPHSTGPDFRKAWNSMPRWLQNLHGVGLYAFIVRVGPSEPGNRSAWTGSKPPPAALIKSQGRERGGKSPRKTVGSAPAKSLRTERHPALRWLEAVRMRMCGTWEPGAAMRTEKSKCRTHKDAAMFIGRTYPVSRRD
jgi:hypothetical protein